MDSKIKELITVTLAAMLVIILFTACGGNSITEETPHTSTEASAEISTTYPQETTNTTDTIVAAYRALESEFFALESEQEFTMTAETRFDLLAVDGAIIYVDTKQVRTNGLNEVSEIHRSRDVNGTPVSQIEMIIYDDMLYLDADMALFYVMLEVLDDLAGLGISMEDVPFADITGAYTHMQSLNETAEILRTGIYDIFGTALLEDYLSLSVDGVFRIELSGTSIDNYIDAVLETMNLDDISLMFLSVELVADIDDGLRAEMEENFARWLRSGNLSDARLIIERTRVNDNNFYQTIELYIPGRVSIRQESTVIVGESSPISAPSQFLTGEELGERILLWIMSLMEQPMDASHSAGNNGYYIRNAANYWVELDGVHFALGQTVADFEETKFEVAPHQQDIVDGTLAANTLTSITFQYQTQAGRLANFTAGLINSTNEEIPMRDAIVRTIVVDNFTTRVLDSNLFMAGIIIGETTQEEIIALFGAADDSHGSTIMFRSSDWAGFTGSSAEFTFSDGVLSGVRFMSH